MALSVLPLKKQTARYRILILFSALFFLTGCFEVIEDITLNSDGSGKLHLLINLSQSKTKIASVMLLDSVNGVKIPSKEEIVQKLAEAKKIAEQTPGITNVNIQSDFTNFIFTYQCNFRNTEALNLLISRLSKHHKLENVIPAHHPHYHFDPHKLVFTRSADYFKSIEYSRMKATERNVLEKGIVVSVYRFQNKILSCTNKSAVIAPTGAASMLKLPVANCVKGESTFSNKIYLAK